SAQRWQPLETHRGAGAVRQTNNGFQIFRPVRRPPELPREIRRCDPLGARLQPLVPVKKACPILRRLHDSLRLRPRSTKYPPRCYRRRYAPNRGERLLFAGKVQNSDELIVQKDPMPSVPLQRDYAQSGLANRHAIVRGLKPAYYSAPLLVRSLPPWSAGKRRSLRNANPVGPQRTDNRPRAKPRRPETVVFPCAISERLASRKCAERFSDAPERMVPTTSGKFTGR